MEAKEVVEKRNQWLNPDELDRLEQARKSGIREVVEFEDKLLKGVPNYGWQGFLERRQAKLKEWGL